MRIRQSKLGSAIVVLELPVSEALELSFLLETTKYWQEDGRELFKFCDALIETEDHP